MVGPVSFAEKRHFEELQALGETIRKGGEWPIPLWQQVQATDVSLRVEQAMAAHG